MPLPRVNIGDRFKQHMKASTWNAFCDAADSFARTRDTTSTGPRDMTGRPGEVLIKNVSGADRARFAILVLTGIVLSPTDNADSFKNGPVFQAGSPDGTNQKIVILSQPIASNAIGWALVYGVAPVELDVDDEDDEWASSASGDVAKLATGSSGIARILWKETGTGTKWGVVQFPAEFVRVYKAIADESAGTISVKAVESDGDVVGDAITLTVLP